MNDILKKLRAGLDLVDDLAPLSGFLGDKGAAIGKIVTGLSEVAQTVLDRIEDGAVGFTSEDQEEIRAINIRLAALNDRIAAKISAS